MPSRWVPDIKDIDYTIDPMSDPQFTDNSNVTYYSKSILFNSEIEESDLEEGMELLYNNFIDCQITSGKKLQGLQWWGIKKECLGESFQSHVVGWLAWESKYNK